MFFIRIISTVILLLFMLIVQGCEGPAGPPGLDAEGVDTTPPTIKMIEPWPLSTVYDEFKIAAAAVDNVSVSEVVFTIDGGTVYNQEVLVDYTDPYAFTIDAWDEVRLISEGWHFISARAYDTAGNFTETPIIPIFVSFSEDLHDTLTQQFNNGSTSGHFALPDTLETYSIWNRFNVPVSCILNSISIHAGGSFSDSSGLILEIWDGNILPEESNLDTMIAGEIIEGEPAWHTIDLSGEELDVNKDFFILLGLKSTNETDTLLISHDSGLPYWNRGGTHDEEGFHLLNDRYGVRVNLLINCELVFASSP